MKSYNTEYKNYSNHVAIMISTDRSIFLEKSAVRARMIEYSKGYKELYIIIFSTKRFEVQQISENCTVYSTNSLSRLYYVSGAQRIGKKILKGIEKTQPLLITCQDPFETGLVGKCLANVRKNSELLLQIHTDLFSPYFSKHSFLNRVRLFISKYTLPQADVIRVVSKKIADSLVERGIDEKKIVLKPIEVATTALVQGTPAFDLRQKFPQFKKIILMVSRLESEKNIDMALDAMRIVVSRIPDAGLVIVGSGSKLPLLKKQAYNLKIDSSVAFEGWQTDLIPYYKGCDIFLLTSWFEGYGMVLKEAEAFGCRIVSTNVGIAQEIGASIVEYSPQSIAEKIIEGMN